MEPKLNAKRFKSRTPLYIRRRNGVIFFQTQIEVARSDGFRSGIYYEYSKIDSQKSYTEIGGIALSELKRFDELSDLSESEFSSLTGVNMQVYEETSDELRLKYMGANNFQELMTEYEECSVHYDLTSKKFSFSLSWLWKKGKQYLRDDCLSTGQKGLLEFKETLEFDFGISSDQLGKMIIEALHRGNLLTNSALGNRQTSKSIMLNNGKIIRITPPKDEHFIDYDDAGTAELYQVYSYIDKNDNESILDFMLTSAPELYDSLNCEAINKAWNDAFDSIEKIQVFEGEFGVFRYSAEMEATELYRLAYFTTIHNDLVLECCLEVAHPKKKKSIIKKLLPQFKQFVMDIKF